MGSRRTRKTSRSSNRQDVLVDKVVRHYLTSHDFNGLPGSSFSAATERTRADPTLVANVRVYVYVRHVKRRELEARLRDLGWAFLRNGGSHDVWSDGERFEYVPRHAEINENLARKILRKAATKKESDS